MAARGVLRLRLALLSQLLRAQPVAAEDFLDMLEALGDLVRLGLLEQPQGDSRGLLFVRQLAQQLGRRVRQQAGPVRCC
ncbi:hypothetical protein ACFYO0_15925 [Streptomyces sp. NPDC006365]|uniref:hypothetical protein n=1 Tax=Streptomyces sp. NPDC006365 TaxID=3364744 RepID=UPI0036C276D7